MPISDFTMFRTREQVLADMLAQLVDAIPDAHIDVDGNLRIIFEIDAGQFENAYLANQLVLEDMFITTASLQALKRHGAQYGVALKDGTFSSGTLQFEGDGGTYIPALTQVGYDPGSGLDVVFFHSTEDGTIPDPGDPDAPTAAVNAAAGNPNGTYEYVVTFVTDSGETLPSEISNAVAPANKKVDLTDIPLGGPGTNARRIYRAKDGSGIFRQVNEIADNVTDAWLDNVTDATMDAGSLAPTVDMAHRITVDGQSDDTGVQGNVIIGTITALTNAPATLTGVTNPTAFIGGSDPEDTESYRQRLLSWVQNPQTGSPSDLKSWAENIPGVESATVFQNDPGPGESTVRISGPGGTVPSGDVIDAVQTELDDRDIANMVIHVDTFIADPTDVTVDVTTEGSYSLGDVTPSVIAEISAYINSLEVGETLRISGVIDAVFGLPGVADVTVTLPVTNLATASTDKRTPDTILVT